MPGVQAHGRASPASRRRSPSISRTTISPWTSAVRIDERDRPEPVVDRRGDRSRSSSPAALGRRPEHAEPVERRAVEVTMHGGRLRERARSARAVRSRAASRPRPAARTARWGTSTMTSRAPRPQVRPPARASSRARRRRGSRGRRSPPPARRASTAAARARSSVVHDALLLRWICSMDPVDAIRRRRGRRILLELAARAAIFMPDLATELAAQMRRAPSGAPRACRALRPIVPEHRVVDPRDPQVGRDLHAGHRDEPDARVLQPRDLLGEDLAELLADALGPRSLRHAGQPTVAHASGHSSWSSPVDQLDAGPPLDEPLHLVHDPPQVVLLRADGRDADRRALPQILVVDLGDATLNFDAERGGERLRPRGASPSATGTRGPAGRTARSATSIAHASQGPGDLPTSYASITSPSCMSW